MLQFTFFTKSITYRLILFFAVILFIFCSLILIITIINTKKNITETIQGSQLSFANYVAQDIDVEISKSISFFNYLAGVLEDVPENEIPETLSNFQLPAIFRKGVVVISPSGKSIITEKPVVPGRKDLIFTDSEWFQRAKQSEATIVSKPFRNRITQEPSIVFACPVRGDNNKLAGVVAGIVGLDQPQLFRYLYNSHVGKNGGVLVISPQDKLFVASNIPEMVLKPTPESGKNKLHDKAMMGYRGVGVTVNAYGVEEISAMASIVSTGWFVVIRIPTEEAYRSVRHLSKNLIGYFSLLIVAIIVIGYFMLFITLNPLKKYSREVKKMASGQRELGKLSIVSMDEVGGLIHGFNSLVDTVNERTSTLKEAKIELEIRINEVKQLSGLLPICAQCKKIRDDRGYWNNLESYLKEHSDVEFSHGICKECAESLYGKEPWYKKDAQ